MDDIVIVSAARTPVGASTARSPRLPAHELGEVAIQAALSGPGSTRPTWTRSSWARCWPPARGRTRRARRRWPPASRTRATAYGVNQLCGSGLRAVALAAQAIRNGDSDDRRRRRPGEHEPVAALHPPARRPRRWATLRDRRHDDQGRAVGRLQRLPHGQHGRERRAALADHPRAAGRVRRSRRSSKAEAAQKAGRFKDEIAPVMVKSRKGDTVVDHDEYIRSTAPRSRCSSKLRPAFDKDGTVTAGNASGINDGAAALVLMSAEEAAKRGPEAAGAHRVLGDRRGRSGDHGHGPDPGLAHGAGEGRLDGRRPRPDRGQRGVRGAGLRGGQGPRLRSRQGQRQRRRDRASATRSARRARACW